MDAVAKAGHFARCGRAQAKLMPSIRTFFETCNDEVTNLAKKGLMTLESYMKSVGMCIIFPCLPVVAKGCMSACGHAVMSHMKHTQPNRPSSYIYACCCLLEY